MKSLRHQPEGTFHAERAHRIESAPQCVVHVDPMLDRAEGKFLIGVKLVEPDDSPEAYSVVSNRKSDGDSDIFDSDRSLSRELCDLNLVSFYTSLIEGSRSSRVIEEQSPSWSRCSR